MNRTTKTIPAARDHRSQFTLVMWTSLVRVGAILCPRQGPVKGVRGVCFESFGSAVHFRRTRGQSPRVLKRHRQAVPSWRRLASCCDCYHAHFLERGLGGCEASERDAVWRARDVVEAELVAEGDRRGLAAVLATDAHLQVLLHAPAALDGDPHQLPYPTLVEDLERVPLEDAVLEVARQELALRVVAREAERRLGQVVRPEGEEVRVHGDLVGADARARELDHRADEVLDLLL